MRAAPKAVDGAATAATQTSRRRRRRRFTGRNPLWVGNHENVQTLCDDAVRKGWRPLRTLRGRSDDFKRVDRSFQTDGRARPARPDVGAAESALRRLLP